MQKTHPRVPAHSGISRRRLLQAGATLAAGPFLTARGEAQRSAFQDAGTLDARWRQNTPAGQAILLKRGTVVSMDPKVGNFAKGDVLIQGKKIAEIAAEVKAPPGAQVIDASNTIVIPGF